MEALEPRPWNPARQCTATNRQGERCRRQPIPGGNVCVLHGGSAPAVQAAARLRLTGMVEPVLDVFEEIVTTYRDVRCPTCNRPTGDPAPVIQVGKLVLDRAGFHPSLTVEQVPETNKYAGLSTDALIEKLEGMLDLAYQARDREQSIQRPALIRPRALPDADVSVVDVEPEPVQNDGVQIPEGNCSSDESSEPR